MIFQFICSKKSNIHVVMAFLTYIEAVSAKTLAKSILRHNPASNLETRDLKLFKDLLQRPPHLLTLEDMTFCQGIMQILTEANMANSDTVAISLTNNISTEWRDGCRIYYIPSSKDNRTLRF